MCNVRLNLNFSFVKIDSLDEHSSFGVYSIMISSLAISQIFSTIWLNYKIENNFTNSNSVCIFTIAQNIIWNAFGSLCHFYFAVNYEKYVIHFAIPSFIFFLNCSIFELRLLYNLWKNQNTNDLNDPNVIRKKLIKFYMTFYILLFLFIFFISKFYFLPIYVNLALMMTWLPQIINNIIFKNQFSFPWINIILISINKLMIPLYFRASEHNIFYIKPDSFYIYQFTGVILIQLLILQLQCLFGPRFFIPSKFCQVGHQFYRTREELLDAKNKYYQSECAICLQPLFISEYEKNSQDFEFFIYRYKQSRFKKFFLRLYIIFFDFHDFDFYIRKKPFILTPCLHAFHSKCLENWLRLKRECPTDRKSIPSIGY